jgi:DNA-directed RNA polymerase specialized sigma24 family protein
MLRSLARSSRPITRECIMIQNQPASAFPATHWSCILSARDGGTPAGRDALAELCRAYWYPVYGLVRRQGHPPNDAADLTQEYFARLIQGGLLRAADRDKGRFRAFLRTDCRFFLADERDRDRAQKRGGGTIQVAIDPAGAEGRLGLEPADEMSPDRLFDRAWALSLLSRSFDRLASIEAEEGRGAAFEHLKCFLTAGSRDGTYAAVAEILGMTAVAVQSAVARLRRRYRDFLRSEIAGTLAEPTEAEIDEELRALYSALSR